MENIMEQNYGCEVGNFGCYCSVPEFGFGIRDCANEACGSAPIAQEVISRGSELCAGEL